MNSSPFRSLTFAMFGFAVAAFVLWALFLTRETAVGPEPVAEQKSGTSHAAKLSGGTDAPGMASAQGLRSPDAGAPGGGDDSNAARPPRLSAGEPATGRRGAPRGSSTSAHAKEMEDASLAASLPLEPPLVPVAEILAGVDLSDPAQRARVVAQMEELEKARRHALFAKALALGIPLRIDKEGGGLSELFAFRGDRPLYRTTLNINAAISSAANLIRQTAPYNLSGAGLKVGVWDAGSVRATHREFGARVTKQDPTAGDDDHATHVAGTVAATGVEVRAGGMAPLLGVDSYDWFEDTTELTAAGASSAADNSKLPLSNHSYGADTAFVSVSDWGRYHSETRNLDSVAAATPYLLQFWSAGNEQDFFTAKGGFETISFWNLAKNIMTVGAVNDAVTSGLRDPAKGTMSSFSSWGPCDDGRIKPDVVANGVGLFSPVATGDAAYDNYDGTSMASPSAMGSAALLVELYKREFAGQFPRASLLKALLIHTADDLGNAGPDYKYGWGLIDVKDAADLILAHKADPVLRPKFYEGQLSNTAKTQTHSFTWDGTTPLKATLVWTDPAGTAQSGVDSRTPNLVHNLDLRITAPDGTTVFQPFVMPFVGTWTTASMSLPATKGDNNTDNVEQVSAGLPGQLGTYTMTVTVDGTLTTTTQDYSIVLTGAGEPVNPPPVVNIISPQDGSRIDPDSGPVTIVVEATDVTKEQTPGVVSQVSLQVNGTPFGTLAAAPFEFSFTPSSVGAYTFRAQAVDSEGATGTSKSVTVNFAYPPPGTVRDSFIPPSADDHVQALAADPQERIYVGGRFTKLGGGNVARLGRLRPDGSVDPSFFVGGGPDAQVRALLHVPQAKGLYVGGHFANFAGTARRALVRLRTGQAGFVDGSLDPGFAHDFEGANTSATPHVVALARQSDGKLLVGGFFAKINGVTRSNLARFNADGTLDTSFAPNPGGAVNCIALQADGKILVGGSFTTIAGQTSRRIARLLPDGRIDTTFVTGASTTSGGFDGPVNGIAVTLDGEVIAGGSFTSYNGRSFYNNLAKLLPGGAVDGKFNFTPGLNGVVNDVHLRPGGEILVSGLFTTVANSVLGLDSTPVGRILQINATSSANGTLDAGFNFGGVGADGSVLDSITLPNGDLLLGGAFTSFNGEPRARLVVIAGFEKSTPVIVSQLFHNVDAGADLEFPFRASGDESYFYQLNGPLPRGVTFDPVTGALRGLPLDAGRYDLQVVATSSRGSTKTTRFVLNVNDTKVPYARWKKAWFSGDEQANPAVSDPGAVRNSAGLSNYLVYALGGGDPEVADASLLPLVQREKIGNKHYLTLTAPKYPGAEAIYRVESSENLSSWAWVQPDDVVAVSETPTQVKFRAAKPATEIESQFLRLKVLAP
jgi:uncharacterized delta-60 repeat protein